MDLVEDWTRKQEQKRTKTKVLKDNEWQIEEDLMLKEEKLYIQKDKVLRVEIIWLHHNILVAEYGGKQKMTQLVMRNYWWPGITKDVEKYVDSCDICQRIKNRTKASVEKLMVNKILEKLQTHLIVDFITKLLLVAGKDVILVVCNRLSKMTHFVVTTEKTLVKRLARLFRDNVWKLHRLPESVISDKEPQFTVELTKELNKMLGIKTKLLKLFYLQTNSQTE